MRSLRFLALSGLLVLVCVMLTACGGSGSKPTPPASLMITTTSPLPQATINTPYTYNLNATGGTGTYTWSLAGGSLPMGITLNTMTSFVMGTPTQAGTFNFTAKVTDGAGDTATANLQLNVNGAIAITCTACLSGTTSLPYGSVGVPFNPNNTDTFSAAGGVAPYTWCVQETNGTCDNGAGGALGGLTITADPNNSANAIVAGTPTQQPAQPLPVTINVSDSETIVAHASTSVTLTIFSITPSTLPAGSLGTPYSQVLAALGGSGRYTWTLPTNLPPGLSFEGCSIHPTCTITGVPSQVGTYPFTVQVADTQDPPATATAQLSISINPSVTNALLNGNYALTFLGYNNGQPFVLAASVIADGQGNLTGGKLDVNYGAGEPSQPSQCDGNPVCPIPQTVQTGSTYDLTTGNGLGTMTIMTLDSSNNPHTYVFQIAVNGNACTANSSLSACGTLIQFDPANPQSYGSGFLKVQDPAFFTITTFLPGNFALLENGVDPSGKRYAAAGALGTHPTQLQFNDIDCDGNGWGLSAGCPIQVNDNGNSYADPLKGSFSSSPTDPMTGRGQYLNVVLPNDPNGLCQGTVSSPACGFTFYIVNQAEMILMSTDPLSQPANMTLWSAYRQKSFGTGWTLQQMSGNTIMELTGLDNTNPDVIAGILNCNSSNCVSGGSGSASFSGDENDAGTLSQPSSQGTIAVATSGNKTGQFSTSGFSQPSLSNGTFFLYSGNAGYFVGDDAKVTSGVLELQSGSPYSNASIVGSYQGGSEWIASTGATNSAATLFADGQGNIAATQYTNGPGGLSGPNNFDLTYQVDSTGRAVVQQNGTTFGIAYVVGPKKVILLPAGNGPALNVFISGQPD